jgi:hypothetical protein
MGISTNNDNISKRVQLSIWHYSVQIIKFHDYAANTADPVGCFTMPSASLPKQQLN